MPAAYAVAINFAYLFVKMACLEAGCCQAKHSLTPSDWLQFKPDLRMIEMLSTSIILAASCLLMFGGQYPYIAAATGLCGHLAVRLLSRWARQRLPQNVITIPASGLEIIPLTLAALLALLKA